MGLNVDPVHCNGCNPGNHIYTGSDSGKHVLLYHARPSVSGETSRL